MRWTSYRFIGSLVIVALFIYLCCYLDFESSYTNSSYQKLAEHKIYQKSLQNILNLQLIEMTKTKQEESAYSEEFSQIITNDSSDLIAAEKKTLKSGKLHNHVFLKNRTINQDDDSLEEFQITTEKKEFSENILNSKVQPENGENIFFVETGDSTSKVVLSARQTCAIESAALSNPNLRIFVLYVSRERLKKLKLTPNVKAVFLYPNVHFNYINIVELAAGSPMEDFINSGKLSKSQFRLPHTSDVLRLLVLWRFGGTYLDTDMIVRKSVATLPANFACKESKEYMNGAFLSLHKTNDTKNLTEIFIAHLTANFDGEKYSENGPILVTKVVENLCKVQNLTEITAAATKDCQGFHVLEADLCYPIAYQDWEDLVTEKYPNYVMKKVKNSIVVHFWNKFSKNVDIKVKSKVPYVQMAKKFCPKVFATCKEIF